MTSNGETFLDKVLDIVRDETGEDAPLIRFKHPKELENILDLDVSEGTSDEDLEACVRQVLHYSLKTNKATFRNQLFGAMDPYGLAGAWITEAFNSSQYTYEVGPAFTLIEAKMLSHIRKLFGFSGGDGIFSPGGSMSLFYAVVAARYKAFPECKRTGLSGLPALVVFTSQDSHYSVMKAAHWLGLGTANVISIKPNDKGQMIPQELEQAIKDVKDQGKCPIMVNATAGTTVLGAIDFLEAIADICQRYGIWMHVDACWGGSLMLSKKYKNRLNGIERAQSLSWNAHKMIGAPLQCSIFLIKQKGLLHEANSAAAKYLFQQDKFYDVSYDTGDKSVQCGRKIDSFKLWLMWKSRGDAGLSQLLDETMELAEFCLQEVSKRPGFRLVSDTLQCPNVCFWYIPTFLRNSDEDEDWWNKIHKVTPKIKELLFISSRLMVAYSPLRRHKNFFRLAFSFHPDMQGTDVLGMLKSIEDTGETITEDTLL